MTPEEQQLFDSLRAEVIALRGEIAALRAQLRELPRDGAAMMPKEAQVVEAINVVRQEHGLHPLTPDECLSTAAQGHANDMARNPGMVHTGSDGSLGGDRMRRAGYDWRQWGEVVGWGFDGNASEMMRWWLNSPDHRDQLLDPDVSDIGVGYVNAPGSEWGHYWTVNFGSEKGAPGPSQPQEPGMAGAIDLLRFKVADPDCWRVVRHPSGAQEDVQDMGLGGGLFVRRKGSNGEWHRYDEQYFYLIHDTSPDVGTEGIKRVYTLYKDGRPGAPKSRRIQAVGEEWHEAGLHQVQFRARHDCRTLAENSGEAQNHSTLTRHERNYTFNRYGQNLTFDEVLWEQTGVETQIYGRKDGRSCGWIGWSAPWGESEPVAIYWDRHRMTHEPDRVCVW